MKKKWQKFTVVNNIVCAVLLVVTFATMLVPCWDFVAQEKVNIKICRDCEYTIEAKELEDDFICPECGSDTRFRSSSKKVEYPDDASVMEFTWLAFNNTGLTEKFESEGLVINDIVGAPVLLTLCTIVGVLFCLLNIKGTWHSLFPLAGGLGIVITYLTNPVFQVGTWVITLVSASLLSVAGLALFAQFVAIVVKWFVVPVKKK